MNIPSTGTNLFNNNAFNFKSQSDKLNNNEECQTCANRKYKDGSDDPGVSFKTASKISAGNAESAVRSHENEHVVRNQAKASRENKEIVYQSVTIKQEICPECGKTYVSGGETKTVTKEKQDDRFNIGFENNEKSGNFLNTAI